MKKLILILFFIFFSFDPALAWVHGVATPQACPAICYYVSSSGNDANNGTSPATAWQTSSKVAASVFNTGDKVLFECGTWSFNSSVSTSGLLIQKANINVSGAAVTFDSYGACQATFNDTGNGATFEIRSGNVAVQDIKFTSTTAIWALLFNSATFNETLSNISVVNSTITGYATNGTLTGTAKMAGTAILVLGSSGTSHFNNVTLLNDTIDGTGGTLNFGIHFDSAGTKHTGSTWQGNVVSNIAGNVGVSLGYSGNGLQGKDIAQSIWQYNLSFNNGAVTQSGPSGMWVAAADTITYQFQEVYNIAPTSFVSGGDWDGFDFDISTANSLMQYNYAHDNWGAGFLFWVFPPSWQNNVMRYNVGEKNAVTTAADGYGCVMIANSRDMGGSYVYNNTCMQNGVANTVALQFAAFSGTGPSNCTISNNIWGNTNGAIQWMVMATSAATCVFTGNDYWSASGTARFRWSGGLFYTGLPAWQAATGVELISGVNVGLTSNPSLVSPNNGGTCNGTLGPQPCPSAYQLQHLSPMVGMGLNLNSLYGINTGVRDYYGDVIPNLSGTGYNVGAYGAVP